MIWKTGALKNIQNFKYFKIISWVSESQDASEDQDNSEKVH